MSVRERGFNADLILGKQRENCLGKLLARELGDWLELKYDEKCRSTGNVFVELRQPDRRTGELVPSGISTSTADWWAFEYDTFCWLIVPTSRLRVLVDRALEERGITMGGDGRCFEGVLVPIEWLVLPEVLWPRVRRAA